MSLHMLLYMRAGRGVLEEMYLATVTFILAMHIDKELELVPWCHTKANHRSSGMGSMQRTVVTILHDCDQ